MEQYLSLLRSIQNVGTHKPAARENMPGTISLFGYQFRHNLAEGFPLLTTKKMYWKGIVLELLWFLKGDTNIKFLVDNGVNIWNEDAYQYYCKIGKKYFNGAFNQMSFDEFINDAVKEVSSIIPNYKFGDCGYQYGRVWRNWRNGHYVVSKRDDEEREFGAERIDQIKNLINSLKNNPESRRHILTSIDPAHENDLALYWCHCLAQFNCRPLSREDKIDYLSSNDMQVHNGNDYLSEKEINEAYPEIPKYYLDCQLYQRSADVVLGVPFNIASYALLTHIFAKICNMIPGEFIHTFGDVHIYDNHKEAVEEQLKRIPTELPNLNIKLHFENFNIDQFNYWLFEDFQLENYNPQPKLESETKLSTGMTK